MATTAKGVGARFGPWDDKFELKKVLDKGAQGEVFVCRRIATAQEYAVKKIDVGTLEMRHKRGKVRTNLKREIDIMRELTHPRIVNLLEAYWESDICFIVMDLASEGCLHDKLQPDIGLPGGEAASKYVCQQLLEGIGYMHENMVVHRDLKPANILITRSRADPDAEIESKRQLHDVKIADFGLSRCLNEVGGDTAAMTAVGTPAFAAPEVLRGDYDEKADFWSFGCILYTMLCGEYPFDELPDHIRYPNKFKDGASPKITDCASWRAVSTEGQSIVNGLLSVNVKKRLNLGGCMRHAWLSASATEERPLTTAASARNQPTVMTKQRDPGNRPQLVTNSSWSPAIKYEQAPPKWPCFQGVLKGRNQLVMEKRISSGQNLQPVNMVGVVQEIRGWSGSAVDNIEIIGQDGNNYGGIYGGNGGVKHSCWKLSHDEVIIAVRQEVGPRFMGAALVFYTSKCQIINLQGTDAVKRRRFVSPVGFQIVGLQFENSKISGVHLEKVTRSGEGAIEKLRAHIGFAVDSLHFHLRDGSCVSWGGDGGDSIREESLEKHEYVVIVEQQPRDPYLANSISFYTSTGRVVHFSGMSSTRSQRYMASIGNQICGINFEDVGDGNLRLAEVTTCPQNGDVSKAERIKLTPIDEHSPRTERESN